MEGKQAIKFDKYNSQAMKGIAIVIMLFHHMYLSQDRFEGLNVVFTPFSADRIMYLCRTFKICVPIYAFISGYGLYLSYRKNNSTPGKWTAKRLIKTMGGFWIIWGLSVVSSQLYNGYAVARYFGYGNIAKGVSAMVLVFFCLPRPYNGLSYPLRLPPTKREPCGSHISTFYLIFFRQRSSSGNRASRLSSVTVSTVTCGCRAMRWRNSLSACCKTPRMGISPSSARNTAA